MIILSRSERKRCSPVFALVVIQLMLPAGFAVAESATKSPNEVPRVPERLHYLFDLPWCKRWSLLCIRCEKKDDQIACEKVSDTCGGFQQYYCEEYNVPGQCLEWSDGCNVCERISCPPATSKCGPRFQCVKSRQN
jgi:hypothetical protein